MYSTLYQVIFNCHYTSELKKKSTEKRIFFFSIFPFKLFLPTFFSARCNLLALLLVILQKKKKYTQPYNALFDFHFGTFSLLPNSRRVWIKLLLFSCWCNQLAYYYYLQHRDVLFLFKCYEKYHLFKLCSATENMIPLLHHCIIMLFKLQNACSETHI